MKNVFKFLGIIALVAVIGFSMAGCDTGGSGGGGGGSDNLPGTTWNGEGGDKLTFNADKKVVYDTGAIVGTLNGTYTISGNSVNVNYKGTLSGANYNEDWVYTLSGNTLTVKSATGTLTQSLTPQIGYKFTKQ